MKKFITNVLIFTLLLIATVYAIFLLADGYADPYYLKFSTPKQNHLILGTSKSAQGLQPQIFQEELGINLFNYSFDISKSPFGPVYLASIKRKLNTTQNRQTFVLTVDAWSISSRCQNPNDTSSFRENQSCVANMQSVDKNPNYAYLTKYMFGGYYKLLFKSDVALLHNNGWLEVNLATDTASVNRRTKSTLIDSKSSLAEYKVSNVRLAYLEKTVNYLANLGDVYVVRLPVSPGLFEIEQSLIPDFNALIAARITNANGYLDLSPENNHFTYTDGVHLEKNSGAIVSKKIALWIESKKN